MRKHLLTTLAFILALSLGLSTLLLDHFSSLTHAINRVTTPLLLPGIIGSMAVAGNAHAFSLWVAAGLNTLLYFLIFRLLLWGGNRIFRRFRSASQSSDA